MDKKSYYITTPIYYPNDNLHLGHTYTTIVADVLKRFKTIQGYDVFFTTGTDEHGQKIQEAAAKAGKKPLEYVDGIVSSAKELWKSLEIDYDCFRRTTDKEHEEAVQKIFKKLYDKGEIYKGTYKGHYCTPCEAFWTETQLVDGKCPDCGREVKYREEESYFFRLSAYRDKLLKYYDEHPDFIKPLSRKNEMINNFLKDGLEDLSVSRSNFDWGVKVPFDEKHVIYVWIDALSCYLTGIGYNFDDEKFKKFWPANVHIMAKEIIRFHAIIWPALLMALDLPLPDQVFAHGWVLFDDGKMSKSKGNIIYAEPIIERYGVDALKYFLLREFTFGQDGNFTNEKFLKRINSDLANDLGNLVSRTIQMVVKYNDGIVPSTKKETEFDKSLIELATSTVKSVEKEIDALSFSTALEEIWKFIRRTNKYIDETCPWVLAKEGKKEILDTVLYNLIDSIRIISQLIEPFMPKTARKINEQLSIESFGWDKLSTFGVYPVGNKLVRGENLFQRLDLEKEIEALEKANSDLIEKRKKEKGIKEEVKEEIKHKDTVTIDDFDKLELKLAEVIDCSYHPKADKLLVFKLKIGNEERQIVSGIRAHYENPKDLIGKKVIAITNLKPVNLRGVESNGMLLSAEKDGKLSLLSVLSDIESGADIS